MCWVDLGQLLTQPLSQSLASEGQEKKTRNFMGQDKDREITYQLPSWAKQTRPGEN